LTVFGGAAEFPDGIPVLFCMPGGFMTGESVAQHPADG